MVSSSTNDMIFYNACCDGRLNEAKMLLVEHPEINVRCRSDQVFRHTCSKGHLHVAKWLSDTYPDIDVHCDIDFAFRYACENGHFEVAKWLVTGADIHALDEDAFRSACTYGHLEIAKWLVEIATGDRPIDIYAEECGAFRHACRNGHLEVAQWLYSGAGGVGAKLAEDSEVQESVYGWIVTACCELNRIDVLKWLSSVYPLQLRGADHLYPAVHGHLELTKWLLTLPSVRDRVDKEHLFKFVCRHGKLETAKFLVETFPNIDVHVGGDQPYREAKENEHLELVRWFLETYPETQA